MKYNDYLSEYCDYENNDRSECLLNLISGKTKEELLYLLYKPFNEYFINDNINICKDNKFFIFLSCIQYINIDYLYIKILMHYFFINGYFYIDNLYIVFRNDEVDYRDFDKYNKIQKSEINSIWGLLDSYPGLILNYNILLNEYRYYGIIRHYFICSLMRYINSKL